MKNINIEIKGMTESSFLDWDGRIVTTIYLPKCNFECPFCHNWELIEVPKKFDTIPLIELDRHLRGNRDFLDGVCITGGEPTIYSELPNLIEHIQDIGLEVKLDTNGTNPKLIKQLIEDELINYIAMDIKGPLDDRYNILAGKSVELNSIKNSIEIIMESSIDYEFRTTVVPSLLTENDFLDIASSIIGAKKFVLQQFVPKNARDTQLQTLKPYDKNYLQNIQVLLKTNIKNVILRGVK